MQGDRKIQSGVGPPRMRAALVLARRHIAADRALLIESHTVPDKAGRPRMDTFDRFGASELARLDRLLAKIDRAIGGAS